MLTTSQPTEKERKRAERYFSNQYREEPDNSDDEMTEEQMIAEDYYFYRDKD